jgi:L-alanine-DL-glutamate epimerase-like enolase superfamily enzyme
MPRLEVRAYEIPTDGPDGRESDGTLEWSSTTCVVVLAREGTATGLGYTYGPAAVARFVADELAPIAAEADALKPAQTWSRMNVAIRNAGREGVGAMAISAVDTALWDLAARLVDVPLVTLLGQVHDEAAIYGSGGFCNYEADRLQEQLGGWAREGIGRVKLKVGRDPDADAARVVLAREAIGPGVRLMADANGAYQPKEAVAWAHRFAEQGVDWLEEPVSSDDLRGLAEVRRQGPPGLMIAAGEYAWDAFDLEQMLEHDAVDALQADVTRCGGFTGLRHVDGLCRAREVPLSAHCAPSLSTHALCAAETALHLEYFHDHVRIESMLFDGVLEPRDGALAPDLSRPGNGLELKAADAEGLAL